MSSGNEQAKPTLLETLYTEVPRLLVLVLLLLILLTLLTRFKWVHCSQVVVWGPIDMPTDWCQVYCTYLNGPASKIAIVYGTEGIGDPVKLSQRIVQVRMNEAQAGSSTPYMISLDDFAYDSIKGFDVVFFEKDENMTPQQAAAVQEYIASGGTIVWIGDSGTKYYYQNIDVNEALALNQTHPFYYEDFMQALNTTNAEGGFGSLTNSLGVKYSSTVNLTTNVSFLKVAPDNLMVQDLVNQMQFTQSISFASVEFNPAIASEVAKLTVGSSSYPAIIEVRNPRLSAIYVSFPLEDTPSDGLITNILDYLVLC